MVFSSIHELIEKLADVIKMPVSFYSANPTLGNPGLYIFTCSGLSTDFCRAVRKSRDCDKICFHSDVEATVRAYNQKTTFNYTCPFGLEEIIAPIIVSNKVVAYIQIGQIMQDSPHKEKAILDMVKKYHPDSIEEIRKIISNTKRLSEKEIESHRLFLQMTAEYIEQNQLYHFEGKTLGFIIKSYINNNFNRLISLEDIARSMHCSTVTVTNTFRKEYGITVMQYLRQKRLELAQALMKDSSMSINEIALQCGFSDSNYFTKTFIKVFGISPTKWRAMI